MSGGRHLELAMSGGCHLELVRPKRGGPLFVYQDCRFLTHQRLVHHRRAALQSAGISTNQYSGHSCRIGAASTAARAGIEDSTTIKMLGRWESAAFLRYIRMPRDQLAAMSTRLARVPSVRNNCTLQQTLSLSHSLSHSLSLSLSFLSFVTASSSASWYRSPS